MYQQVVPRAKPIYAGTAKAALSIGTAVKAGSISGSLTPITADTDRWLGVVTADVALGDAQATIALRGGGQICTVKLASPCDFGSALYVTGSTAGFTTSSVNQTTFTISASADGAYLTVLPVAAYALQAGVTNDLVDVVLA